MPPDNGIMVSGGRSFTKRSRAVNGELGLFARLFEKAVDGGGSIDIANDNQRFIRPTQLIVCVFKARALPVLVLSVLE